MYNYQIKDKDVNLTALEILAEFQKNPKKDVYETLVQDMADEMLKALGDKPKNEKTYLEILYPMFKPNPRCYREHYVWDFEEQGLTVQLIPYHDNDPVVEDVISHCLLPSTRRTPSIQPIEYVIMHEILGLFIVMPVERWCKTPQEVFENYVCKDDISLVYATTEGVPEGYATKMSYEEYLTVKETYSVVSFELCGRKPYRCIAFGFVGGKVYYYNRFYVSLLDELDTKEFITKEEMEKRIVKCEKMVESESSNLTAMFAEQ